MECVCLDGDGVILSIGLEKQESCEKNPQDSARKDLDLSPKVGPLHCQSISQPIAISHPYDPRSSRAPPSEVSVNLMDTPDNRNSWSRASVASCI